MPFTPSQGICTPSPSNLAVACGARRAGSDHTSSGSAHSSLSPATEHGLGPFIVPSLYPMYPISYSPGGAHPIFPGPHTPSHAAAWSPGAIPAQGFYAAAGSPGPAAFVGSPATAAATPGRTIFAQYLQQEGYGSDKTNSPPGGGGSEGSSPGQKLEKRAACPGALEAAVAWCAEKGVHCNPPQAVIELASLAMAYGIGLDIAAEVATAGTASGNNSGNNSSGANSSSSSPSKPAAKAAAGGAASAAGSQQVDNGLRLNARQRRTLRRALDRASSALETAQQQLEQGGGGASTESYVFTTPVKSVSFMVDTQAGIHTTPVNINAVSGSAAGAMGGSMGGGLPGQGGPIAMWQGGVPLQMPMPIGMSFHSDKNVPAPQMYSHMPHHHVHLAGAPGAPHFPMGPVALSPPPPGLGHSMHPHGSAAPIHHGYPVYHQQMMPMQHVNVPGSASRGRHGVSRFAPARAVAQ